MNRERRSFSALGAGALCGVTYAGVIERLTSNTVLDGINGCR